MIDRAQIEVLNCWEPKVWKTFGRAEEERETSFLKLKAIGWIWLGHVQTMGRKDAKRSSPDDLTDGGVKQISIQ